MYLASDSLDTPDFIKDACGKRSLLTTAWPTAAVPPPCVFSVDPEDRFRTEHGSHTVAAGGGCHGNVCAMHWYDILKYQNDEGFKAISKPKRMMISLYEVRDML